MQLSKREKLLIGLLACILVILVLFFFLIAPQLSARTENKRLLTMLRDQKKQTEETIAKADKSKKIIRNLEKEAEELYDLMSQTKSYDISLTLSEMLGRHGLTPVSLEFSDYEEAEPPGKEEKQQTNEAEDTDADPEADGEGSGQDEKKQMMTYALARTAVLRFIGAQDNAEAFLDEITNYNISCIVSGYTLSDSGSGRMNEVRLELYEFVKPEEWKSNQEEVQHDS